MKFGIVGTNFVSDFFMKAASYVDEAEVVGVCSGKKENAINFSKKYNIPYVFDDYISMIESKMIDAIYIATPNVKHYEMVINSLNRKIPVFCEKPLGTNVTQVKKMIDASKTNNTYLHDGIVPLYTNNLQIIKDNLANIGKIRKAVFSFSKYSSRYDSYLQGNNPTTFQREMANGSMMDLGIYVLSDAIALFGKPNKVSASAVLLDTKVDCLGTITLTYDDFEVVLLHSKVCDTNVVSEISGEKGIITFEIPSLIQNVYLSTKDNPNQTKISVDHEYPFAFQLMDFIKNVKQQRIESTFVPHSLSLEIHDILTRCRLQCDVIYDDDNIE